MLTRFVGLQRERELHRAKVGFNVEHYNGTIPLVFEARQRVSNMKLHRERAQFESAMFQTCVSLV